MCKLLWRVVEPRMSRVQEIAFELNWSRRLPACLIVIVIVIVIVISWGTHLLRLRLRPGNHHVVD